MAVLAGSTVTVAVAGKQTWILVHDDQDRDPMCLH